MKKVNLRAIGKYLRVLCHRKQLQKIRQRADRNPENLILQVRVGDLLAKMRREKEAVKVYEEAAQKFIRKDLFGHAIALKKLILRLNARRYREEEVLPGLHQQMMEYRERAIAEGPAHMGSEAARS